MIYEPVIGLEIHVELKTKTKAFCGCANESGAEPNTRVCPVCGGLPGAMPRFNREALRLAVAAGLALGCEIRHESRFDRKNYFYPDLPKGYQITQFYHPLCVGGSVILQTPQGEKRVGITRIHMEEDAGKLVHSDGGTAIDLNRCGVPLIEIVTEPDIRSGAEAGYVFRKIRDLLVYAGVTEGKLNEGNLRCDVNLSLHRPGEPWGTRTETKNLNSYHNVEKAVNAQIKRQTALLDAGQPVQQMTMRLDSNGTTVPMRPKEQPGDYRYFPEPDLPPVIADDALIASVNSSLPKMPDARRREYIRDWELNLANAQVIALNREKAQLFERGAKACGNAQTVRTMSSLLGGEVSAKVAQLATSADDSFVLPFEIEKLVQIARLQSDGRINATTAKSLCGLLFEAPEMDPQRYCADNDLFLLTDPAQLLALASEVLCQNDSLTRDYLAGKEKVRKALMGKCMSAARGRADAALLEQALTEALQNYQ